MFFLKSVKNEQMRKRKKNSETVKQSNDNLNSRDIKNGFSFMMKETEDDNK